MNKTHAGLGLFIGALGTMLTLEAVEVSNIVSWSEVFQPAFVAKLMAHTGTVIGAYYGGKLVKGEES